MKKRMLSLLLTLCMALTLMPATALAAGEEMQILFNGKPVTEITIPYGGAVTVTSKLSGSLEGQGCEWMNGGGIALGYAMDGSKAYLFGTGVTTKGSVYLYTDDLEHSVKLNIKVQPAEPPKNLKVPLEQAFLLYSCYPTVGESYAPSSFAVEPYDIDRSTLIWGSSDPKVLTVNDQGVITAVGAGNAWVRVTSPGSKYVFRSPEINVKEAAAQDPDAPPKPPVITPGNSEQDVKKEDIQITVETEDTYNIPTAEEMRPITDAEFETFATEIYRTHRIVITRNSGVETTNLSAKNIKKALEAMGSGNAKKISGFVKIYTGSELAIQIRSVEEAYAVGAGSVKAAGHMVTRGNRLWIETFGTPSASTIVHELGHVVHTLINQMDAEMFPELVALNQGKPYSIIPFSMPYTEEDETFYARSYGMTNRSEDFATVFEELYNSRSKASYIKFSERASNPANPLFWKAKLVRDSFNFHIGKSPLFDNDDIFNTPQLGIGLRPNMAGAYKEATDFTLSNNILTLKVDGDYQLNTYLTPRLSVGDIAFTSDDENVATVTPKGVVVAVSVGSTTIRATMGGMVKTCKVEVSPKVIKATSFTLPYKTLAITVGEKVTVNPIVTPAGSKASLGRNNSNANVVTLGSENGVISIYGRKAGTATLRFSLGDYKETLTVTVSPKGVADGWYNLRVMGNYVNLKSSGYAELRNKTQNDAFYVENKGDNKVTLKVASGKYIAVGNTSDGSQLKTVDTPYEWKLYSEKDSDVFSLRPVSNLKKVVNAKGTKNVDGTPVIVWTEKGTDAPNHAEFRFIPVAAPGGAVTVPTTATATPSPTKLVVNGKQVAIDAYAINGNNYIKIRDMAYIINGTDKNFEVTWDGAKNAINLISKKAYTTTKADMAAGDGKTRPATSANSKIYVDGADTSMTAYVIGQNNYFKLRDVMQIFNVNVGWDQATGTASLDTSRSYEK